MGAIGFDNQKYLTMQSEQIKKRIHQFGGKLYLEFGGKLFDDYHASRVLPGFEPDSKIRMLQQLKDDVEIVIAICAGDIEKNVAAARAYSRFAVEQGYIPIAPHLLFPQFLNDTDQKERELGLFFGNAIMSKCSEVWVFGSHISSGMETEIKRAKWKNYRLRYFTENLEEV